MTIPNYSDLFWHRIVLQWKITLLGTESSSANQLQQSGLVKNRPVQIYILAQNPPNGT
jgi:hypothetical protein